MRIIYLADLDLRRGGGQRRAYEIIKRVSINNKTYVFIIDQVYPEPIRSNLPIVKQIKPHDYILSLRRIDKICCKIYPWRILSDKIWTSLKDTFEDIDPDIIIIAGEWVPFLNFLAQKYLTPRYATAIVFNEPPIILSINNWESIYSKLFHLFKQQKFYPWRMLRTFLSFHDSKEVFKKVPAICVGPASLYFLRRIVNIEEALVVNPPNAVDHEFIKKHKRSKSEEPSIVFLAARLNKGKGLYDFINIYRWLKERIVDLKAFVMGNPSSLKDQEKVYSIMNTEKDFKYLGFVDDSLKYEIVSSCWLLVYPSITDAFSLTVLEALSCGTPALTYNIPAFRLCYSTESVQRVPYDWRKMAERAYTLLRAPQELEALSVKAKKYASKYKWDEVVKSELEAYREVIEIYNRKTLS